MELDYDNDPFPPSLPRFDEPRIFDAGLSEAMKESGLELSSVGFESPENLCYDNATGASYQSPDHGKSMSSLPVTKPDSSFPQSPGSSIQDSSSESSNNRHKRNHSSESSRSGVFGGDRDICMTENTPVNRSFIGTNPLEDRPSNGFSKFTDVDISNRAMEHHFDFDSAASSPNQHLAKTTTTAFELSSMRPIKIPYRFSQNAFFDHGYALHSGGSNVSIISTPGNLQDTPASASMLKIQSSLPPPTGHNDSSSTEKAGNYIEGSMLSKSPQTSYWSYNGESSDANTVASFPQANLPSPVVVAPYASPLAPGAAYPPRLHIHPLPPKSRVETQIPVKLTLYPFPQGITKLHLQTYTISKSKLVAKPPPKKSPDMLELYAMLVCTSAMQDSSNRKHALARAAGFQPNVKTESRRSLSIGHGSSEEGEEKTAKGGPVHMCMGCIERERKRTARKKTKNIEEEQLWQKDEAKRTVVFNTCEVKEWQSTSLPRTGDKNSQSIEKYCERLQFPENTKQVDIPMRIACYCRHHEEKTGFQVIFTIKDYQDNMVAQMMTNSIVITDDHKTHATPSTLPSYNAVLPDNIQVPGAAVSPESPSGPQGPASFRHAHSMTDLLGMQQQTHTQPLRPFALPNNASQTTSATLTPMNPSCQTSPSISTQQYSKKRKASTSGRVRNDLTMTKLQNADSPLSLDPTYSSAGQPLAADSGGTTTFVPNYANPHGHHISSQSNTNPATPSTTDRSSFVYTPRSQSMDNFHTHQNMISAPTSIRPSRVPSPANGPQNGNNVIQPSHAQLLTNSLHSVPGALNPHQSPIIHKLTPGEGSKSGGIEVTCLGSGFRQGLEVMFGDAQATTTTYWGGSALVCLVPPALQAGIVPVTFKHNYGQNISSPTPKQVFFKYVDDDEQELMKHALALINRKVNYNPTDAGDSARNILNFFGGGLPFMGGSSQGSNQQRQAPAFNTHMASNMDLEAVSLNCLILVDLDDSPYQASLNVRGMNGQSMLHFAASLGFYRLVAGLLARGANPDLRDNNGLSPMHIASLRGQIRIIRKLRSVGGDSTLRSLNGFTPADMATSKQAYDVSNAFDAHAWSRSVGTTPVSSLSRASSSTSVKYFQGDYAGTSSTDVESVLFGNESSDEGAMGAHRSRPMTPVEMWAQSRRNSLIAEDKYPNVPSEENLASASSLFITNPAMSAWRDQISAQIQQLQQSVHRTLPNLQIPTLPPIPNLPDYQAYPVVRRISSLVPQRAPRLNTANDSSDSSKDADYHWWELLTGASSSPPAYDDIYPKSTQSEPKKKDTSVLRAVSETSTDGKSEANLDQAETSSIMDAVNLGSKPLTQRERVQLRNAHARKVKRLRSDRNLFFIWIPLLVLVSIAMLKDRAPQGFHGVRRVFRFIMDRFLERAVEVV